MNTRNCGRQFLMACVTMAAQQALAQFPVIISVAVQPPYNASYASYYQNPGHVVVNVTNTGPGSLNMYLAGAISTVDGSVAVRMLPGTPWASPITLPPGATRSLTGSDLQPLLQGNGGSVEYVGITEDDIRTGLLPEGEYQICLQAFDYNTNEPLSEEDPSGCSNIFNVRYPAPPVTITPACEEPLAAVTPQLVLFTWTMPVGMPQGTVPLYGFRLAKWPESIDAVAALQTSTDLVYEEDVATTLLTYSMALPPLEVGQRYVWRVQATDLMGIAAFQNDGYSEPCSFTYMGGSSDFSLAYPANGDTLPWDFMPIIQRFDPYALYTYFHSFLDMDDNGVPFDPTERLLHWASGPQPSQQYLLRTGLDSMELQITEEQSQQINIYRSPDETTHRFTHGHRYNLSASIEVSLDHDGNDPVSGSFAGSFVSGMGRPVPLSPANNSILPKNGGDTTEAGFAKVDLRFKTSEPPSRATPEFPIWYMPDHQTPVHIDGQVDERWLLEISKDQTFASTLATQSGRLGMGLHLLGDCDEQCVIDSLYKDVAYGFTPPDTGTYYWRVRWLNDPNATSGTSYLDGPTWKFRVRDSSLTHPPDTLRTTPGECLAECRREPVPLAKRVPVATAGIGDTVQVGLFDMKLTEVHWTGASAKGKGTISVPFMHAPLKVAFDAIHINAEKRMYDGVVKGDYDNADVIPPAWIQGGAMAAGFNAQDAGAIENYVNAQGRFVSQMTLSNPMGLPIALDNPTPGGTTFIGILALKFTDTLATLNAAMRFSLPEQGIDLGLGGMDIPFHPSGPGCADEQAVLYLFTDVKLNLSAAHDSLVIKGARFAHNDYTTVLDSGTFVAWDCQGFRALTIAGEVRFSKDHLVEDLPDGNDGPAKVVGAFMARTGRHGFLARIDFNKPFHIKGGKGWGFDVQEAWYDKASYTNPPNMVFPKDYAQVAQDNDLEDTATHKIKPLWEGLYVKRAMMRLPHAIKSFNHTERTTALVDNLIYDDDGLSASIKAANLLGTDQGNLDGWGFSMDTLQLDIVANSFSQAGFKGRIHVPITDTLLVYSAMLQQNIQANDWDAQFLIHPHGNIKADLWKAQLQLDRTSYITAVISDTSGGTYAKLELNGKLTIDKDLPTVGRINFKDIHFNHLTFQTRSPYTNADDDATFSFTSPQKWIGGSGEDGELPPTGTEEEGRKAGGFPVTITKVELTRRNPDGTPLAGLAFDINLNLTGDVNVFTATTRIAVLGELNTEAMHHWDFHGLELDSVGVIGDVGAVKVRGGLRFYNGDGTYGDGIKGLLRAEFIKGKLVVQAAAQFGNMAGNRYWFVDAQTAFDPGIDAYPGFTIYGFGGGAWYHMHRNSPLPNAQALVTRDTSGATTEPPGFTLTNVSYLPDAGTNFGFEASMLFGNPGGGQAYNADVSVGAELSASGGVASLFLNGNVYFMVNKDERTSVPVHGTAAIQFDFPNEVFTANFQVFVNIKDGLVRGAGANDLAGQVSLLISADDWHLFAGTPQVPIGLKFAGLFNTSSYFMIGENLPEVLAPPTEVTGKFGITATSLSNGRPDVGNGLGGFAFGSRMSLADTLKFLLLRFRLAAALGFDLSLLDHGDQQCVGMSPGEVMGVDGWYASGQVFGYFEGTVSLYVDLWLFDGEVDLLDLGAAVLLQGGLPNPSWITGSVGGYYSVLGGAVSGHFTFPMEIGTPCSPPSDGLLSGLDPIGDLVPHNGTYNVDCGVNPEAALNMKVDHAFNVYEVLPNGERKLHTFRLSVDKFELKQGDNAVTTTMNVNSASDHLMLVPNAFLKAMTLHSVTIRLKAEEKNLNTNVWAPALKDGQPVTFEKTNVFHTGPEPNSVDPDYVNYTYPFQDQRYFLQGECDRGMVEIRQDMTVEATGYALFDPTPAPNKVRTFKMLFTPTLGGATQEEEAEITGGTPMRIFFNIPPLENHRIYTCQLISRDSVIQQASSPGPMGGVVHTAGMAWQMATVSTSSTSQFNGMVNILHHTIQGYTLRSNEKLLFTFHFGTSQYNTLNEKVASLQNTGTTRTAPDAPELETLTAGFIGETFDEVDISGYHYGYPGYPGGYLLPLVWLTDARTDHWSTAWNQPLIYDYHSALVYSDPQYTSLRLVRGTYVPAGGWWGGGWTYVPNNTGIPPINTVTFDPNCPHASLLSAQETTPSTGIGGITGGMLDLEASTGGPSVSLVLNVATGIQVYQDYLRMQTITADIMANYGSPFDAENFIMDPVSTYMRNFLNSTYWRMYSGDYQAQFHYRSPASCPGVILMGTPGTDAPPDGAATYHHSTGTTPYNITIPQYHVFNAP